MAKHGPGGTQPFGGTHSWAPSKGQARELLWQALRGFDERDAR